MFEEYEGVNKEMAVVHKEEFLAEYESTMHELEALQSAPSEVAEKVNKMLAELSSDNVANAAQDLSGHHLDQQEEALLTQAKTVYTKLLKNEHPMIADYDILLADCYIRQQQTYKVRPCLLEALEIYTKSKGTSDKHTIVATLRLGQFDRDQNRYTEAKAELETALAKARK
jgi:tetratricopeptide (TPR) repeat protein